MSSTVSACSGSGSGRPLSRARITVRSRHWGCQGDSRNADESICWVLAGVTWMGRVQAPAMGLPAGPQGRTKMTKRS